MSQGRFSETKGADQRVASDLECIVARILEMLPQPRAIILTGGFGRGEGSVSHGSSGFLPLNDYDLVVLSERRPPRATVNALGAQLAHEVGIDFVDIALMKPDRLRSLRPSIFTYELKRGSQVVFGDSTALCAIPAYDATDIHHFEGLKLLLNRMAGILGAFTLENLTSNQPPTPRSRQYLQNQVIKALMACGDSMVLQRGAYHHLYKRRLEAVSTLTESGGAGSLSASDMLLIRRAYEWKLEPDSVRWQDPVPLLYEALPTLESVFLDVVSRLEESKLSSILDWPKHYRRRSASLDIDGGLKSWLLPWVRFTRQWLAHVRDLPRLVGTWPFQHRVQAALPCLTFSLPGYREDDRYLMMAGRQIGEPVDMNDSYEARWDNLRGRTFAYWVRYCE